MNQQVVLTSEMLQQQEMLMLLLPAYAVGNDAVGPITNQWVYGSVRSDDAYKGGGGRGDVDVIDRYEQYNTTIADLGLMLPRT
jgi:hypothetical protein